jgi:hypothetical protein
MSLFPFRYVLDSKNLSQLLFVYYLCAITLQQEMRNLGRGWGDRTGEPRSTEVTDAGGPTRLSKVVVVSVVQGVETNMCRRLGKESMTQAKQYIFLCRFYKFVARHTSCPQAISALQRHYTTITSKISAQAAQHRGMGGQTKAYNTTTPCICPWVQPCQVRRCRHLT